MSKYLSGVAALALLGAATFALPATAAERQAGVTNHQSTEFSSQRHYRGGRVYARHWRGGPRFYGPRRYWGPAPTRIMTTIRTAITGRVRSCRSVSGPFGFWF